MPRIALAISMMRRTKTDVFGKQIGFSESKLAFGKVNEQKIKSVNYSQ